MARQAKVRGKNGGAKGEAEKLKLTRETFDATLRDLEANRGKLAKVSAENGALLKNFEDVHGGHKAALSLVAKLNRQDEIKRDDFLRSFDQYRDWMGWNAPDLVDQAEAAPAGDPASDAALAAAFRKGRDEATESRSMDTSQYPEGPLREAYSRGWLSVQADRAGEMAPGAKARKGAAALN